MGKKEEVTEDIGRSDIEEISRNVHVIKTVYEKGFNQKWLFVSDVHYDSIKCKRELLKKHFDQAKKQGARIGIIGDWFDLMGGKYDPRTSYSDIRPEYKHIDYMDQVVNDSYEFLKPYVDNITLIAHGNHETSYLKRTHTNPLQQLVDRLNYMENPKEKIILSGYAGWLILKFMDVYGGGIRTKKILYWHGQRSNAQRSKGVLQIDLDTMKFPDVDIIMKGDDHNKWYYPMSGRFMLDANYKVKQTFQRHIRLGSYKDGLEDFYHGWEVEKGFQPLGFGGFWIDFYLKNRDIKIKVIDTNDEN